jgi:TPR repeat protein
MAGEAVLSPGQKGRDRRAVAPLYFYLCIGLPTLLFLLSSFPVNTLGQSWSAYDFTSSSFPNEVAQANGGNVTAELSVAKAYYAGTTGTTPKRNYLQAAYYFQAAANGGSAEANAWLGSLYLHGHGVVRNLTTALNLIQASANSNNPIGLRFLALMYVGGVGVTRNYAEAVTLFNKAASLNDPVSYDHLGNMYLRGLGVSRNVSTAVNLFNQGIKLGDPWSMLHLGELYAQGVSPLTKNTTTALNYYVQSASAGNYMAAFRAGVCYETGTGTGQSYASAWNYYKQAALKGYAPAQRAIGRYLQNGLGGNAVDLVRAYVWYSLAAVQGDGIASAQLVSVSKQMTSAQVQQAQTMLASWEQARGGPGVRGSGTVTINGSEESTTYQKCVRQVAGGDCLQWETITVYDRGTVSITVDGFTKSVAYGTSSTASSIALALAEALSSDQNSPVKGSANGDLVTLTAKATGTATDYTLSASSATSESSYFGSPSFTATVSGSSLTGGQ